MEKEELIRLDWYYESIDNLIKELTSLKEEKGFLLYVLL